MKARKLLALTLCLGLMLTACGSSTGVYVQSVEALVNMGGIAPGDAFAGIVVSEHVTEVKKDSDKTVEELLVREGDDVKEGDPLFSYDLDELQLALDKAKLEVDQLNASIATYKAQIQTLESERSGTSGTQRLQYTVEIQSTQVDLKEAELKVKSKELEVEKAQALVENATVLSPITGRIQEINESGTDDYGNAAAYITIQQSGSYRLKGTLGELQRGGILEGDRMTIFSRTDENQRWSGTVTLVDYENPSQGSDSDRYYGNSSDEMTAGSKYPFYVELDSTEGLILGQHVYMTLETEEGDAGGLSISQSFVCYEEDGSAYVWAEHGKKLEKRTVTLGEMNDMNGTVEILEGLTLEDYIAFPDESCAPGVSTTHDAIVSETVAPEEGGIDNGDPEAY